MSGCDLEALESLAFGELTPTLAQAANAHVATCPACAAELSLLLAERGAFAERARDSAALPLPGFSAALALSRWSGPVAPEPRAAQSPGPVPAKAPLRAAKSRFTWVVPAFAVAAAAAFAGLFLLPPRDPAQIESPPWAPILAEPASQDFCRDEAFYDGITAPPRTATVCEMPEHVGAQEPAAGEISPCGSCAHETICTGDDDSSVTEACYPPLPD
jgi:hypothetical protein